MENGVLGTKQRDTYLDIAKAIGILMVIYAHVSLSGILYTTFYAFHIPLFFVVAGMTFNNKKHTSFKTFAANKAKRLLLPYLIYSLATFAWWAWVEVPISGTLGGAGKTIFDSFIQIFLAQGSLGYMTHFLPK
jgi:acyltransferase